MLVPLRIPSNWAIRKNWFDYTPLAECKDNESFFFYSDECLVIEQIFFNSSGGYWSTKPGGYLIDLGWIPSRSPNGAFHLEIVKAKANPSIAYEREIIYEFVSSSHDSIRHKIEQALELINQELPADAIQQTLAK